MKKVKLISTTGLVMMLIIAMIILPSCKIPETETVTETVIETITETVTETVEVTAENPYTFEALMEMAREAEFNGTPYPGAPAAGHTLAFHNILQGIATFDATEANIIKHWELAGGSADDFTLLVNNADITKASQNADIIYSKKPEVWVQYFGDEKANTQWARRSKEEGIFMIAVNIAVSGFPFVGIDFYKNGVLTGEWALDYINNEWGGWDEVDLIGASYAPFVGDIVAYKTLLPVDYLWEEFGDEAAYDKNVAQVEGSKVVLVEGSGVQDTHTQHWNNLLAANPDAKKIVAFNITEGEAAGVQAAAEMLGRWNPDDFLNFGNGVDALGQELLRKGYTDASVANFPELYGMYIIPVALAYMYGNSFPAATYVDHVMIDLDNIDEWYPE